MALATQCPHCHTTFRVAHDQLKLRAGLVRCGSCKQIFNGIENLLRPEEAERLAPQPSPPSSPQPLAPAEAPVEPAPRQVEAAVNASTVSIDTEQPPAPEIMPIAEDTSVAAIETAAPADENPQDDPLQRMTLLDFSYAEQDLVANNAAESAARFEHSDELDALDKAIDELQHQPWHGSDPEVDDVDERRTESAPKPDSANEAEPEEVEAEEPVQAESGAYEEPSFVRQGRRRQRIGYAMRILMAVGLPLLLLALLVQGVYLFRNQLAAWFPQSKPALTTACRVIRCQVGLPAQIETVAIESSELQAAGVDERTFSLSVLLGNHSATAQAWPSIELTLNDAEDRPIARRVFTPRDYLPAAQDINKGFAPKSEQAIKLYFELSQLKASGYRVYLFYP